MLNLIPGFRSAFPENVSEVAPHKEHGRTEEIHIKEISRGKVKQSRWCLRGSKAFLFLDRAEVPFDMEK